MTKNEFRVGIRQELKAAGFTKVDLISVRDMDDGCMALKFGTPITMAVALWLDKRFANGISLTETDASVCFINTPKMAAELKAQQAQDPIMQDITAPITERPESILDRAIVLLRATVHPDCKPRYLSMEEWHRGGRIQKILELLAEVDSKEGGL